MTREEAIKFAIHAQSLTDLPEVKEFYALAESALRDQEEREHPKPKRYVIDFEICCTAQELKITLGDINRYNYPIVAITQCEDAYTVFFRVPADE